MNTTLAQALQLTVLGMGMTFASIGVLALGMLLLTRMTREKDRAGTPGGTPDDTPAGVPDGGEIGTIEMAERSEVDGPPAEAAARAAAVAVAVALANRPPAARAPATRGAVKAAAAAVAVALAGHGSATPQVEVSAANAWDGYGRSAHLSSRARYDVRRVRG